MINWPSPLVGGPLSPGVYPSSPCGSPMGSCEPYLSSLIPAPGSPVPCEVFLGDLTAKAAQSIKEREDLAMIASQRDCEYATDTMKLGSSLRESELLKRQLEDSTKELMMAKARSESIVRDLLQAQQQLELERSAERNLEEEYENKLACTLHLLEEEDRRLRRTQLFGLHHKATEVMTRQREIESQRQEIQLARSALEKQLRSCEELNVKQHIQLDLYHSELQRTRLETERRRADLELMDVHANAMYAARVQASLVKTPEKILSKSSCLLQKNDPLDDSRYTSISTTFTPGYASSVPPPPPLLEDPSKQFPHVPFPLHRATPPVSPVTKEAVMRPPIPPWAVPPSAAPSSPSAHSIMMAGMGTPFHAQSALALSTPSPTPSSRSSMASLTNSKYQPSVFPPMYGTQDSSEILKQMSSSNLTAGLPPFAGSPAQQTIQNSPFAGSPAQQAIQNATKMLSWTNASLMGQT